MSINVLTGRGAATGNARKRGLATSSAAARAAATTQALGSGAIASDSGSTAVQSGGLLGKVGSFLNKVSSVAQYMPGVVGQIGGIVNKLTSANDPEWWNTVPGDGLTCNDPLQLIQLGEVPGGSGTSANNGIIGWDTDEGGMSAEYENLGDIVVGNIRPTFLELLSTDGALAEPGNFVIEPTDNMVVQYLLPQIRHVVNAVYLQDAQYYKRALQVQATMYALWRQYKKIDFFLKHGKSFVPNTNDPAYPIFQVENASYLQSIITRLEEYLHANVRLPHTLCEYLAWRFGRVYRINSSAKSAFVMYNVLPLTHSISTINSWISWLQNQISSTEAVQKAAADIYNGYCDHDQEVIIADENMIAYDPKEFVLRTNLDLKNEAVWFASIKVKNNILMDSNLDNPTTFMASTVSCQTGPSTLALFPVYFAQVYAFFNDMEAYSFANAKKIMALSAVYSNGHDTNPIYPPGVNFDSLLPTYPHGDFNDFYDYGFIRCDTTVTSTSRWYRMIIKPGLLAPTPTTAENPWNVPQLVNSQLEFSLSLSTTFNFQAAMCKAMEFYNVGLYVPFGLCSANAYILSGSRIYCHDVTSLAQDQGVVEDTIIVNEQVLAFANLMAFEHKDKTTYRQVEKRVARDLANTIEQIPVASVDK